MTKILKKDKILNRKKLTEIIQKWIGEFKVSLFKNAFVHLRTTLKLIFMLIIGLAIICFLIFFIYKPIYSVSLNGEFIGYSEDKSKLQEKIND